MRDRLRVLGRVLFVKSRFGGEVTEVISELPMAEGLRPSCLRP
jgi:hypothetical protein